MGNFLEPIVDAGVKYVKWNYNVWFGSSKFDFSDFFKTVGLKNKKDQHPKKIKEYDGNLGRVYLFNVPAGLSIDDFKKIKNALEIQIKNKVQIRLARSFVEIELVTVKLPTKIDYSLPTKTKDTIHISIGESIDGVEYINLKTNPHSYIVGATGTGKSVCTKSILSSLSYLYSSNELELYLCDLKMVELALFRNLKHTKKFVYTVEDTTEVIADLLEETKNRYELFMENEVTDIFEYNKLQNVKKLKYQVLFVEEIVILLEDKSKKAMKLLKQLIAISRASGCYVFLTTQRPSNDVIDNVVKSNINNRIVFKCEDSKNSVVALDQEGAEDLTGDGHGILKIGPYKKEFRGYYITDKIVKEIIKPNIRPKLAQVKTESIESNINDLSFLDKL